MSDDYAKAVGARLREVRDRQGLSMRDVEYKSGGRWKAVVVGSYERADRSLTVQRLADLAEFYGVPVSELLPPEPGSEPEPEPRAETLRRAVAVMRGDAKACEDEPGSFLNTVADWLEIEAAADERGLPDESGGAVVALRVANSYLGVLSDV